MCDCFGYINDMIQLFTRDNSIFDNRPFRNPRIPLLIILEGKLDKNTLEFHTFGQMKSFRKATGNLEAENYFQRNRPRFQDQLRLSKNAREV